MDAATLNKETFFEYVIVDDIEIKGQLLQEAQNDDSNSLDETDTKQCDEKKATDSSLLKAASASSQMRFGYMYHCGKGVLVNYELAKEWYLKAHNNGNTDATNNIGYMYGHGQGVTADAQLASKWYLEAANKGNACAQNNAGYSYENGIGIKRDVTIALEWYEKSAEQGFEKAKHNIVRLNKQVPGYAERENEPKFANEKSLEFKQEVNDTEINMLKTEKAPLNPAKDERNITLFERLLFLLPIGKDKEGNYVLYYG